MIFILAMALLTQSAPPSTIAETAPMGSVHIPDEIAPAMIPYMTCLSDKLNTSLETIKARDKVDGLNGVRTREAMTMTFADCKSARDMAAASGRTMLNDGGDAATHPRLIENTLAAIEAPYLAIVNTVEAAEKAAPASGK